MKSMESKKLQENKQKRKMEQERKRIEEKTEKLVEEQKCLEKALTVKAYEEER